MNRHTTDPLDDLGQAPLTHDGQTRTIHRKGAGPAVVIMHELPGITPPVARFARAGVR